jgi:nitrite reductase (NADH) large subunit
VKAASSVQGAYHVVDQLFRSSLFRQLTGFGIVGALALGSLLSARKRLSWFRWGEFTSYRALHTCLGVAALVLVCVHTGLRLGAHLNLALMLTFVTASLLGAVAGVASYFEARGGERARRLRGALTRVHLWALWPLPALLFFHILSAYYF